MGKSCDGEQGDKLADLGHGKDRFATDDIGNGAKERGGENRDDGLETINQAGEVGGDGGVAGGVEDEFGTDGDGHGDSGDEEENGYEEMVEDIAVGRGGRREVGLS